MLAALYAALLRCYPPAFRLRFGRELAFAFDAGLRASARRGWLALARYLTSSALDLVANGIRERRSQRRYSPRAQKDSIMTTFVADLRFAVRLLVRSPQMAVLAIGTLGLGIGLATSLYAVAHNALVRPLPFRDEARVMMMYEYSPQKSAERGNVAPANFLDWRERSTAFSHMGALRPYSATVINSDGEAVRADGRRVLGDAFGALGLDPVAGRLFTTDDERPGQNVVILSHRFWTRHFGGDPAVVGRSIVVDERPRTVVGVLTPVLRVPGGPIGYDDIFVPWVLNPQQRTARMSHICEAVARIKPGVTIGEAQADIARVAGQLAREYPRSNDGETVLLVSVRDVLTGEVRPALLMLVGAVSLVLLIACVNVANLLLARAAGRRQEMTVRVALGAGRGRLLRQLFAESVLLSTAAAMTGVVLAVWCLRLIGSLLPADLAVAIDTRIDPRVGAIALLACTVTAMIASLAPAWFVAGGAASLARGTRGATAPSALARGVLVTVQVALAVVLLAGAGLLTRSFLRLMSVDPGFRPDRLLTLVLELPRSRYSGPRQWQPFFERLRAELLSIPGVTHAGGVSGLPLNENGGSVGFFVEGQPPTPDVDATFVIYRLVTPGYFSTLGLPLREGRDFSSADRIDDAPVAVVVNETLARRYWPNESALGKRVAFTTTPKPEDWATVVGVVGDTKASTLAEPAAIQLYVPYMQEPNWYPPSQIVVRTAADPTAVAAAVRERIRGIDAQIPISGVQTMESLIARSVAAPRFNLVLVGLLSVSALVLATIGIYGLLAFAVAQRTREIGVRTALGASRGAIAAMVVREGLRLTAIGIAAGLVFALAATRAIGGLLFQVEPHDPLTFAGITALLLLVAAVACWIPARRAARVDPLTALRTE